LLFEKSVFDRKMLFPKGYLIPNVYVKRIGLNRKYNFLLLQINNLVLMVELIIVEFESREFEMARALRNSSD
jgi:hypothetical protein